MPLYDYRCEQGHTFEVSQRMTDDPLDSCERCGAPAERVLHSPAASVAGASTYGTNYSAKPKEKAEAVEKQDGAGSWLDSAGRRQSAPRNFRRGMRRN
ncbi:MAG: FmdB family zinc ribbon protein [Solirubrobacterales bacterium]